MCMCAYMHALLTSLLPRAMNAQGVMESVVFNSFCIIIPGWSLVARNASPNVAYSTISACRCRQIRPFVSFSLRIVLYGSSSLKSSHFLRHFSRHDCARSSLHSPDAQWKLPSGYLFGVPTRAATFLRLHLSVRLSLQPTFPGCCLPAKTLISTLLLPHLACQLQAV